MSAARTPAWMALLLGWLWGQALVAWCSPTFHRDPRIVGACRVASTPDLAFVPALGPRRLRQLPGLGTRRALEVARVLWRRPELAADPEALRGIGPTTGAVLRAFFEGLEGPLASTEPVRESPVRPR